MFLLTALVLTVGAGVAADSRTYRRTDPLTGQQLLCDRCRPGTRLRAHCTRSSQTDCAPCGTGLFTEFWNYIPECLRCDACSDHQRVVRPCDGTVNTVCECEAGFFWDQYFCRKHSECKPGHGVKTPGTPHKDTVCERCAYGHYANVMQAHAKCVTHSACKTDQQLLLPGSRWYDNVCVTCDHQTHTDLVNFLKPALSVLHAQYGISTERLQKLVLRRLNSKKFGKRAALHWFQHRGGETREEEPDLQSILEESQLNPLANRIARKIQDFLKHCANTASQTV